MRFMIIVKAGKSCEAGVMPDKERMAEIVSYHEALAKAGVLVDTSGLQPSSKGGRIRYSAGKRTVIDGPFPETKEIVGGFTIIEVKSREEALEWTKRFPVPHDANEEREIEVRPMLEADDFAPGKAIERFRQLEGALDK